MPIDLSKADRYEAIQIGEQVVLSATRDLGEPGEILFFQERSSEDNILEFAILKDQIPVGPQSPPSGRYAFKGLMSKERLEQVRIYEKGGFQLIPVVQKEAEPTGTTLTLPVIDLSSSLDQAVRAMKGSDARAVVVRAPLNDFRLVTNYDVARAYENDLTLEDIFDQGHAVTSWREAIPPTRDRLFSMVRPRDEDQIAVTSLFESIGIGVMQGGKICRCTSNLKGHTVMDENPSLDGTSCAKPTTGHGRYECF
jgi:G:T/U-mismatch repair DNA glycosylase